MKLQPIKKYTANFEGVSEDIIFGDYCDSIIAVLPDDLVDKWLFDHEDLVDRESDNYDLYWTGSFVFDIDNQKLVVVSDSGDEFAQGEFYDFCEKHKIKYQNVIDGLDCTDVSVDDIYTGSGEDDKYLLGLLHKIYN